MSYEIERYEHAGFTVVIAAEEYIEDWDNPRDNDNLGCMYCWHPDYELGDEQFTRDDHDSMEDVVVYLREERKATTIMPLYLYDHSGISIKCGAPIEAPIPSADEVSSRGKNPFDAAGWDTSMVGFIYATDEAAKEAGNIIDCLKAEVDEYDSYLRGEVSYWRVEDADGNVLESCGGYLGGIEESGCKYEANSAAECERRIADAEAVEVAEMAARDIVTVCGSR